MKKMPSHLIRSCLPVMATLTVLLLPMDAAVQKDAAPTATPPIPRLPDGKPDLSGVYQGSSTKVGPAWEAPGQGSAADGALVAGNVRLTSQGAQRYEVSHFQPWAAQLLRDGFKNRFIEGAEARCLPNPEFGTGRLFPVEFVQTPSKLVILMEYMGLFRNIPLNVPFPDDTEPSYLGTSVGHWDGDTLVVDTRDFVEQLHVGGGGARMHSDALRLTERYTRVDYNTIRYDVLWDDPKVLTQPDEIHHQYMLREGTRVREFVCAENNQEPANYEKLKKSGLHIRK